MTTTNLAPVRVYDLAIRVEDIACTLADCDEPFNVRTYHYGGTEGDYIATCTFRPTDGASSIYLADIAGDTSYGPFEIHPSWEDHRWQAAGYLLSAYLGCDVTRAGLLRGLIACPWETTR